MHGASPTLRPSQRLRCSPITRRHKSYGVPNSEYLQRGPPKHAFLGRIVLGQGAVHGEAWEYSHRCRLCGCYSRGLGPPDSGFHGAGLGRQGRFLLFRLVGEMRRRRRSELPSTGCGLAGRAWRLDRTGGTPCQPAVRCNLLPVFELALSGTNFNRTRAEHVTPYQRRRPRRS